MEARSLKGYLDGTQSEPVREEVYSELARDMIQDASAFMTMIRRDKFKLVYFLDSEEGQLFDLESDPDELNNLWDAPDHVGVRHDLTLRLLNWRIESGLEAQRWIGRAS